MNVRESAQEKRERKEERERGREGEQCGEKQCARVNADENSGMQGKVGQRAELKSSARA